MTSPTPGGARPRELTELALRVARHAATLISTADREDLGASTKSTDTDLVTRYDTAAERLIVDELLAERPNDGVLGEEGDDRPGSTGVRWVVDPIDGTTNFAYGLPGYGVSIGVEVERRLVGGVVIVPALKEEFVAWAGGGATRNGEPIAVRDPVPLSQSLVGTGFAYDPQRRIRQATVVAGLIGRVRDVRRSGAASFDLCSVACGRLDAYFEIGLGPWDLAAGSVIATEAGALVTGFGPGQLVIAAHPRTHASLGAVLAELDASSV